MSPMVGARAIPRFLFQAEGDKLFGTASFLGFRRGIEDGRIDGDKISFTVRFQAASEGMTGKHRNRYMGTVSGNQIHFRMQDDRGNPAGGVRRWKRERDRVKGDFYGIPRVRSDALRHQRANRF
jgi:hypothetical protein